jgi:Amt family ammonium transporter
VNLVRNIFKIDDTLDVFAVHGIGGIFGTLMIAIFGYTSFVTQLLGLIIVGVFTIVVTYALIKIVSRITPLRVNDETETNGLDLSVHGERAYDVNS